MSGNPTNSRAKLKRDDADVVEAWHPLAAHCADVAAVAEALLTHRRRREVIHAFFGTRLHGSGFVATDRVTREANHASIKMRLPKTFVRNPLIRVTQRRAM